MEQQSAKDLAEKLSDGRLVLFVGAGFSHLAPHKDGCNQRIPLWNELAEAIAQRFCLNLQELNGSPLDLFDSVAYRHSRGELEQAIIEALDDRDFELSNAHHALAALPWCKIVTTNYDGLLNRLFEEPYPIADEAGYDRLDNAKILQIHGKLPQPHTLTKDDYRLWADKNPRAAMALKDYFLNHTVLFVGYSLSDPHVDELLALMRLWTKGRTKRHYGLFWQLPDIKKELLDNRDKITAISIDGEEGWQDAFQQIQNEFIRFNPEATVKSRHDRFTQLKTLCEEVDFSISIDEPLFYLGIDVQPGHLAAGLVIERPIARERVLTALANRRNVIIAGPSGSGKSALMWDAAKSEPQIEHWFRITHLSNEQVLKLIQFIKPVISDNSQTIGFIVDDIGRGLVETWDALAQALAALPNVMLLGSIREEDLFLLQQRQCAQEIRELANDDLAERLWQALHRRNQTYTPGWRELWRQSKGLLLEYAHLLTQGNRLIDVLRGQVADRVRDSRREIELSVLRIAATAGVAGAAIDVAQLPAILGCSEAQISRALRRLIDEHLLKEQAPAWVTTLHQLRATTLFQLCHEFPPPTAEQTIAQTVRCIPADTMGAFVLRICELNPDWQACLLAEIAKRLQQEPDIVLAATALRGLGQAHIAACVNEWLTRPDIQELPKTQLTNVAMFGLPGLNFPEIGKNLNHLAAASRSFKAVIENSAKTDPRKQLLVGLSEDVKTQLFQQYTSLKTLNELLTGIIGTEVSGIFSDALYALRPDLAEGALEDVTTLLASVRLVNQKLAESWVNTGGQQALLNRIHNEVAWVSHPRLRKEPEGLAVCADAHYLVAAKQPDVHSEVVRLCELMLAMVPNAQLAIANAIGADGKVIYIGNDVPLVGKRIPRENLLPASAVYWNRQWRYHVADRVATPSYSDYLLRSIKLLEEIVATLEDVLDEWFRKGRVSEVKCQRLNATNNEAETITPPRISSYAATGKGSIETNEAVTDLQSVLFDCSVNLIKRFNQLPEGVNAYIGWLGMILKHIDSAKTNEPWELVAEKPPQELTRLREIVEACYLMAGESGLSKEHPLNTWHKPKAQRKSAFKLASCEVRNITERRIAKFKSEIGTVLQGLLPSSKLFVRYKEGEIDPWPPVEVLVVTPIADVADWSFISSSEDCDNLRSIVGSGRNLSWTPLIDNLAVDVLTVGGIETLFPRENGACAWLAREGISCVEPKRVSTFGEIVNALAEISGMRKLGFGTEYRPDVERDALESAQLALENGTNTLKNLLISDTFLWQRIERLEQRINSNTMNLAVLFAELLRGNYSDLLGEISDLKIELLRLDIADGKNNYA